VSITDLSVPKDQSPGSTDPSGPAITDRMVRRRVGIIWGLLFFNGLGTFDGATIVAIPRPVAQLITGGALGLAVLLVLGLNRGLVIRPNIVLGLLTILAITALMTGIRGQSGLGGIVRPIRLTAFLSVLWLLTPWWGRRDLLLARCHYRTLLVICGTVVLGLLISPSKALSGAGHGRLVGVFWSIPAPQVGEYVAVAAGMGIILWLTGGMARGLAFMVAGSGVSLLLLSHTRTPIAGLLGAIACAALTLVGVRRRVRRTLLVTLVMVILGVSSLAPAVSNWFTRGQSAAAISTLNGRKIVWKGLLAAPRSELDRWLGSGLSDKSFNGLPIDSTWLALYKEQGLLGDAIVAAVLILLFLKPLFRPVGPETALAIFMVVYCAIASYTEVGLGDISPYLLHIVAAASLLTAEDNSAD